MCRLRNDEEYLVNLGLAEDLTRATCTTWELVGGGSSEKKCIPVRRYPDLVCGPSCCSFPSELPQHAYGLIREHKRSVWFETKNQEKLGEKKRPSLALCWKRWPGHHAAGVYYNGGGGSSSISNVVVVVV